MFKGIADSIDPSRLKCSPQNKQLLTQKTRAFHFRTQPIIGMFGDFNTTRLWSHCPDRDLILHSCCHRHIILNWPGKSQAKANTITLGNVHVALKAHVIRSACHYYISTNMLYSVARTNADIGSHIGLHLVKHYIATELIPMTFSFWSWSATKLTLGFEETLTR